MRKFLTGAIVVTRKIIDEINRDPSFGNFIDESLGKYINCDWGNSPECDKEMNDQAIINGSRIFASYEYINNSTSKKIWIITEADRSCTTILFPHEY